MQYKIGRPGFFLVLFFCSTLCLFSLILSHPRNPHDGVIRKAGNYFIEMKTGEKKLYAYLLDKKLKLIDATGVTGEARFLFPDSTDVNVPLTLLGKDTFTCETPAGYSACRITFNIKGKSVFANFGAPAEVVLKNE